MCGVCSGVDWIYILSMTFSFQNFLQYYLEKNLDARAQELEREAELEEKAPKAKAKSKMSKVRNSITL